MEAILDQQDAQQTGNRIGLTEKEVAELFRDHGRNIFRFIMKKVRNEDDAEDILQTAMCEAMRARKNFMWQSKPQTWVCGIAVNLIKAYYARSDFFRYDFETEDALDDVAAEGQDPAEIIARNEVTNAIQGHLSALPEDFRVALTMVAEENHSYDEAAAALGIPVGTVRSRIFRARACLKKLGGLEMLAA